MGAEITYMLGIVAVGFLVNYSLRALPFLLFAGRDRALPAWVERLGAVISPVIIAGLIVYSFATLKLADKTTALVRPWPYVAGLLTVGLQLWKRNALASIVAGTVVYMLLLSCGCTAQKILLDKEDTMIAATSAGLTFDGKPVTPEEIIDLLESADVPRSRVVHIRAAKGVRPGTSVFDGEVSKLMGELVKAGYKRPIVVSDLQSSAVAYERTKSRASATAEPPTPAKPQPVRYKGAGE